LDATGHKAINLDDPLETVNGVIDAKLQGVQQTDIELEWLKHLRFKSEHRELLPKF
jgi:hypothetical protein